MKKAKGAMQRLAESRSRPADSTKMGVRPDGAQGRRMVG